MQHYITVNMDGAKLRTPQGTSVLDVAVEKFPGFQRLLDQLPMLAPPAEQSWHIACFLRQVILAPRQ